MFFVSRKEITKKVYNNIMNSIKLNRMDTIFINSENRKTSDPHRLLLHLLDKINLNMLLYQTLALTMHGKI